MAQTKEQKSLAAKRARLWLFYRTTPEERDAVEKVMREHPILRILLERGDGSNDARVYMDHDHTTGHIRGILGYLVNKALGTIECSYKQRTPQVLRALADYLENSPMDHECGERYGLIGKAQRKKKMVYGPPIKKGTS